MYIFGKTISGKLGGLTAAFFYMMAPYRAVDVYVRGALSEAFSFVWLPLILLAFLKLSRSNGLRSRYVLLSSVSVALLMLTHNLILLPFLIFLALFLMYLMLITKNKKIFAISCTISLLLAAGLSAFFWIPALFEKQYTIVDQILLVDLADYRNHFVYIQQLWNSLWGFGGSTAGLSDGISFKIGKLHLLLALIAFICSLTLIKFRRSLPQVGLTICFFTLFLVAVFMTTVQSQQLWQLVTPLAYLQFPWRFLAFTTLFSSILAGLFVYFVKIRALQILLLSIFIILLYVGNLKYFTPSKYRSWLNDQNATTDQVINWDVSKTSFEYAPRGAALYKGPLGTNLLRIDKDQIPKEKIQPLEGSGVIIQDLISSPSRLSFGLKTQENTQVRTNIFNFPNWRVNLDGQFVKINDDNALKLITFEAPPGNHEIKIHFEDTPLRRFANLLSLFSTVAVSLLFFKKWNKT